MLTQAYKHPAQTMIPSPTVLQKASEYSHDFFHSWRPVTRCEYKISFFAWVAALGCKKETQIPCLHDFWEKVLQSWALWNHLAFYPKDCFYYLLLKTQELMTMSVFCSMVTACGHEHMMPGSIHMNSNKPVGNGGTHSPLTAGARKALPTTLARFLDSRLQCQPTCSNHLLGDAPQPH